MTEVLARHTIEIPATVGEEMDPKNYVTRVFTGFFRWPIDTGYQAFIQQQLDSQKYDNCLLEMCDAIMTQGKTGYATRHIKNI